MGGAHRHDRQAPRRHGGPARDGGAVAVGTGGADQVGAVLGDDHPVELEPLLEVVEALVVGRLPKDQVEVDNHPQEVFRSAGADRRLGHWSSQGYCGRSGQSIRCPP
jgi:hypothetical protein